VKAAEIEISEAEIEAILAPWTIRKHAVDAPPWRAVRAKKSRTYRRKRITRAVLSALLPSIKRAGRHRDPEFVSEHYTHTWSKYAWPDPAEPPSRENTVYLEWNDTGYEALRHGLVRIHLLGIAKAIDCLKPSSVLEIGAGPGINLVALSAAFPDVEFTGAELTASGVETAKSIQAASLPEGVERFTPMPVKSHTAHQGIDFNRCDVRSLPFADEAFDLVFTRLAIEQMEQIRDPAFVEVHRVAKSHAVFVEPFRDFNRTPLQSLATRAKNYISLNVDELVGHGFEPIFQFSDWPHKITNGAGIVVCRKSARQNRDRKDQRVERAP
jgi:ubiquinone/menaquinone biosynthesis C-methylase UbiE